MRIETIAKGGSQAAEPSKSANEKSFEMAPHYAQAANIDGKQHWDHMWEKYREAWFVGNITKYLGRYREKDRLKDLKKAMHYLSKLIELETAELEAENKEIEDVSK